jgi:hypothetical protein
MRYGLGEKTERYGLAPPAAAGLDPSADARGEREQEKEEREISVVDWLRFVWDPQSKCMGCEV